MVWEDRFLIRVSNVPLVRAEHFFEAFTQYSEVILVGVDYGGRTDAFVSVCLSTYIHVLEYGLSLHCGGVKSVENLNSGQSFSALLKLSISSCYTVPPSAHIEQKLSILRVFRARCLPCVW